MGREERSSKTHLKGPAKILFIFCLFLDVAVAIPFFEELFCNTNSTSKAYELKNFFSGRFHFYFQRTPTASNKFYMCQIWLKYIYHGAEKTCTRDTVIYLFLHMLYFHCKIGYGQSLTVSLVALLFSQIHFLHSIYTSCT